MNSGRIIGIAAILIGIGTALIGGLWLVAQTSSGELETGGMLLGAFLVFALAAPLIAFGVFMTVQGGRDATRQSEIAQQRRLLDIVKTQGQVRIADVALELNISVDSVKNILYTLVGLQVYSGYINWDKGVLYSEDASALHTLDKCKNCGGSIELSGKGIIKCQFCGTEYFLAT